MAQQLSENVMRTILAVLDRRGKGAKQMVTRVLNLLDRTEFEQNEVFSPSLPRVEEQGKHKTRFVKSAALGLIRFHDDLPIINVENTAVAFQGRVYSPIFGSSFLRNIVEETGEDREKALGKMITNFEGDFASIVLEPSRFLAVRDPIGVQPLYYGENSTHVAVGSSRSVLWKIGIEETRSFPPGSLGIFTNGGSRFKPLKTLVFSEPSQLTMKEAADVLVGMLEKTVQVRVNREKEIAVAFSGGIDSSMVAFLARKNCKVRLVHVALRGQIETEEAKKAADAMDLPLDVYLFGEEDVEDAIPKVLELVEDHDPVKTAIGIAFHWMAQKTAQAGFRVLLAGQGADELFGGYQRYSNEYCLNGKESVRRKMFEDMTKIHENNIERDRKICNFHNIELRLPFASYEISEFAASLPVELKLDDKLDSERKLILRRAAEKIGIPLWIARKPKKALQYGTGISSALKRIARKKRTTVSEMLWKIFAEKPQFQSLEVTKSLTHDQKD